MWTSSIDINFWVIFYVFFNSSWSNLLQILLGWIRIRIKKAAGSGFALRRTAGSGSAKNESGSTALAVSISQAAKSPRFSCFQSVSSPLFPRYGINDVVEGATDKELYVSRDIFNKIKIIFRQKFEFVQIQSHWKLGLAPTRPKVCTSVTCQAFKTSKSHHWICAKKRQAAICENKIKLLGTFS